MEEVVGEEETEGTEGTACEGNGWDGIERMVGRAGEEEEISVVERSNSESGQEHSQARSLSYLNIPNEEREGRTFVLPWKVTAGSAGLPRPKRSSRNPELKNPSLLR